MWCVYVSSSGRRRGPSFAEATARVVEQKQAGWRSRAHGREWILTFERYAFPRIGKMPVSEVTSADVLEILAPIWHTKADTARRLRQRIRAVLEWAVRNLSTTMGHSTGLIREQCPVW